MKFTGERYMPDIFNEKEYISQMHLRRYEFALLFANDKTVIDIACGEGYGADKLAETASKVTGIDIENKTIEHAKNKYKKNNLSFIVGSVDKIEMPNESIDLIISFETIEHVKLQSQKMFLQEVIRVLKPNGYFIVSTPEKDIYGEGNNEFHLREMNKPGFLKLLKPYFISIELYGQDIKKYGNPIFLFIKRILHKLIKFDKFKIRHKLFPKKFRLKIDNSLFVTEGNQFNNISNDLMPMKISEKETAMFLVAVCQKK